MTLKSLLAWRWALTNHDVQVLHTTWNVALPADDPFFMARPAAVSSVSAAVLAASREGNTCPLSIATEVETDKPAAALVPLAAPSMRLLSVCPGCCLQVGTSVLVGAGVAVFDLGWCCCWLVDLQFTSQRLAIVCLEREELDAGP